MSDPIALVRSRLEKLGCQVLGDGDSFGAQCPAHPDRTPSFSVGRGDDGRALLRCHAGCSLAEVLDALELEAADLFASGERRYKGQGDTYSLRTPSPCPCITGGEADRPELYELIEAYERCEIKPVKVELGELPERANEDDRKVAADLEFLFGLRRADGDLRPLPYSARFCCRRMGWDANRPMRARRALRRLARWGVIDCLGEMAQRLEGMAHGTMLFEPPLRGLRPTAVEDVPQPLEVEPEPAPEVLYEPVVDRAQAGDREDRLAVAAGNGAPTGDGPVAVVTTTPLNFSHAPNASASGGLPVCETCRTRPPKWWRLASGGPWVCATCHPPVPGIDCEPMEPRELVPS